jgi:ubiquinone/menaquinone biosynthesis C-methylase UbiE
MDAREEQVRYYTATAADYESAHVSAGDEHFVALEYMLGLFQTLSVTSVLDVGAGTGRACEFLAVRSPGVQVVGVEPVAALIEASRSRDVATFVQGSGDRLPFPDGSFDAVCAMALMHHVPEPARVIREMMRVARRAVVLSDSNRFGQGPVVARLAKLAMYRAGLWPLANRIRMRGKDHLWSEGDGIFYSYSVYDSLDLLSSWGDRVSLLGTSSGRTGWTGPLLSSSSVMLAAVREPKETFALPAR